MNEPVSVAVIGAGLSGMAAGLRLRQAGVPFTIFEKAGEVGGTWRENRYPGLTIDVPSPLYTFRDHRHAGWRRWMPDGPEIQEYFADVATRGGLRDHIRFNSAVTAARWTGRDWEVHTDDGATHSFRALVCASGFLHHPRTPQIPGLESFAGERVHSAQWRDQIATAGRRIGVIGTGSTGVQLTSALAPAAAHLTLFQRTAQWVLPIPNFTVPPAMQRLLARRPQAIEAIIGVVDRAADTFFGTASIRDGWQRRAIGRAARLNLRTVRDPTLRRQLQPVDAPLCKRPVVSTSFYRTVQRPDVAVCTDAITRVVPEGVITADGTRHDLDVLIFATGFAAHDYMRPIAITGRDGLTLDQAWAGGPAGYRTVALAGFPNLFMVMGPHSPLLSVAIHQSAELQSDYIVQMLDVLADPNVVSVEPTAQASEAWLQSIRAGMPGTVWASGCTSWYLGSGDTPVLWPYDRRAWLELLRAPDLEDYEVERVREAEPVVG